MKFDAPQYDQPKTVLEIHNIKAKEPKEAIATHLRKPSNGGSLQDIQKTDVIFNSFSDQHKDFVKDPHEVKLLECTKAWAQDMVENISNRSKGKRMLQQYI